MSITTDLTTLKINYLTQEQYNEAKSQGQINPNELYFTPDSLVALDTSATSGTDKEIYDALVALGWDSDVIV